MALKKVVKLQSKVDPEKYCGKLEVFDNNSIKCFDENGIEYDLSPAYQSVISKWIQELNAPVTHEEIQAIWAASQGDMYTESADIKRIKQNLPQCVKNALRNRRGYGYDLCGSEVNVSLLQYNNDSASKFALGLEGDYYAFLFDPNAIGDELLGAYFHIEERKNGNANSTDISVAAIIGIRKDAVLLSKEIAQIFHGESDCHDKYEEFKKKNRDINNKYFWAEGNLELQDTIAEIRLKTRIDARWNIWLDLNDYLSRIRKDEYEYRGGIGLATVLTPSSGKFSCKFGIIKKSYLSSDVIEIIKNSEIKKMLSLSHEDGKTIKLDENDSRIWYNWFTNQ